MKNLITIFLSVIFMATVLSANVSAATTNYTCPRCHTVNAATRVCSGFEITGQQEIYPCPYRNNNLMGMLHLGDCYIERHYCRTDYVCNACNYRSAGDLTHMCWVIHTSVNQNGTNEHDYLTVVCSTYINMNGVINLEKISKIPSRSQLGAYNDMLITGDLFF